MMLLLWLTLLGLCFVSDALPRPAEESFDSHSDYCLQSAREVHGQSDPDGEVNHYLKCLAKKTRAEVSDAIKHHYITITDIS